MFVSFPGITTGFLGGLRQAVHSLLGPVSIGAHQMRTATSFCLFVLPILITDPWGQGLSLIKQSSLYMGIPALVWPLGIQNNKITSDNQSRQ